MLVNLKREAVFLIAVLVSSMTDLLTSLRSWTGSRGRAAEEVLVVVALELRELELEHPQLVVDRLGLHPRLPGSSNRRSAEPA